MSKRHSAKHKIDRRLGENIWGRPKSPVNKREYGPGQHGQRRKGKISDFGTQLKRQAEAEGLLRQHLREAVPPLLRRGHPPQGRHRREPDRAAGARLDAIIYRAKFVPTLFAARQFVNHGHVRVNGKRVNIASYLVKAGDLIEVKDASKQLVMVLEAVALAERDVPDYVEVDHAKMTASSLACRPSPTCPIRCRWSRTWWSSSIRADRKADGRDRDGFR